MANWADTAPDETTVYSGVGGVLDQLRSRDKDAYTLAENPTNPPTGALRYLRVSDKFQEWNGTTWVDKVISIAGGGTGAGNAASARTNLGLGTISVQNSNAVAITGGSAVGLSAVDAGSGTFGTIAAGNTGIVGTLTVSGAATLGATLSVAGISALNGGITVTNSAPYLKLIDSTQAADEKHWDIITFGKTLHIRTVKDDLSAANNAITINRGAGTAITRITLNTNVLIAGAILRPDGAGAAITPGNGTNNYFGNQDFYNVAGTTITARLFETTSSTQPRLELRNSFDNLSIQLGEGSTSLYGPNQYSSVVRFNGLGVLWGDLAYFPNGGDLGEFGHFRFLRSGSSPVTSNPTASIGCGALVVGDGSVVGPNPTIRWQGENSGFCRAVGGTNVIGDLYINQGGGIAQTFHVGVLADVIIDCQSIQLNGILTDNQTPLHITASNHIIKAVSSRRYKEDIKSVGDKVAGYLDRFFSVEPVQFVYKTNPTHQVLGFIAEDFLDSGTPLMVNLNADKQPESIKQDAFNAYMFQAIKELREYLGLNAKA